MGIDIALPSAARSKSDANPLESKLMNGLSRRIWERNWSNGPESSRSEMKKTTRRGLFLLSSAGGRGLITVPKVPLALGELHGPEERIDRNSELRAGRCPFEFGGVLLEMQVFERFVSPVPANPYGQQQKYGQS